MSSAPPGSNPLDFHVGPDGVAGSPTLSAMANSGDVIEWQEVVALRRLAAKQISDIGHRYLVEHGHAMPEPDRRLLGRSVIKSIVREHAEQLSSTGRALWPQTVERAHVQAVENAVFGFGRLQAVLDIPDAENIEIHGCDSVVVQFGNGHREPKPPVADTDDELIEAIRFLGEMASPSRPFDDAHPTMTLALSDRFRLHAIGFGLSFRPSITIRQHILTDVDLPDLVATGMLTEEVAALLQAAVLARKSMVISGDQGAGKTTLLRALISAIPTNERFGTLETDYELLTHLQPHRRNMIALQAKTGLGERQDGRRVGEFTIADLMPEALRQNLSRLIVGEVRGNEAGAMFEAMQAGAGTLSTTHSHSAESTMDRLASRVAQGGVVTIPEAYRQIAHNIDLFIHVTLIDDTWRGGVRRRLVSQVRSVTGAIEEDRPVTHLIWDTSPEGRGDFYPDPRLEGELAPYRHVWFDACEPSTAHSPGGGS